jgi:hypothetical protein
MSPYNINPNSNNLSLPYNRHRVRSTNRYKPITKLLTSLPSLHLRPLCNHKPLFLLRLRCHPHRGQAIHSSLLIFRCLSILTSLIMSHLIPHYRIIPKHLITSLRPVACFKAFLSFLQPLCKALMEHSVKQTHMSFFSRFLEDI